MRVSRSLLAGAVLLGIAVPVFADPTLFNLSGTLADGGTLTGALSVNGEYFYPVGVIVQDGGYAYPFQGSFYEGVDMQPGVPFEAYSVSYQGKGELLLALPETELTNFAGGPLCSTTVNCSPDFTSSFSAGGPTIDFTTLTASPMTATSTTPEPGSWLLLGTGLLAFVGFWRRRGGVYDGA